MSQRLLSVRPRSPRYQLARRRSVRSLSFRRRSSLSRLRQATTERGLNTNGYDPDLSTDAEDGVHGDWTSSLSI